MLCIVVDEVPPEHRNLVRDLFAARDSAEYRLAYDKIEKLGQERSETVANAPGSLEDRPQSSTRDNRRELIPMLDDDDFFRGDPEALARRNRLRDKRNGVTQSAGDQRPPHVPEPLTFAEEVAQDGWLDLDELNSEGE